MAVNPLCKAFIDPPYWGDLAEWTRYRDDLRQSGLPGVEVFIRESERNIARLTAPNTHTTQ
jgi:hypothetical protein